MGVIYYALVYLGFCWMICLVHMIVCVSDQQGWSYILCHHDISQWGQHRAMANKIILNKNSSFIVTMCNVEYEFCVILFLHLSISLGCFCPRTFVCNNGLNKIPRTSFLSDMFIKLRIINRGASDLATVSPCWVWGHGWTICLLYGNPFSICVL